MLVDFINIIKQIKELSFSDKLFLTLSFRNLEIEERKILLEQIKNSPNFLNEIIKNYLKKKEFLEKGDDAGYYKYLQEEEKKLKMMTEQYLEEEKQKQIKKIISQI